MSRMMVRQLSPLISIQRMVPKDVIKLFVCRYHRSKRWWGNIKTMGWPTTLARHITTVLAKLKLPYLKYWCFSNMKKNSVCRYYASAFKKWNLWWLRSWIHVKIKLHLNIIRYDYETETSCQGGMSKPRSHHRWGISHIPQLFSHPRIQYTTSAMLKTWSKRKQTMCSDVIVLIIFHWTRNKAAVWPSG